MHHLRPTAIAGVLLAATMTLSSCGFNYPTDQINTIAGGVNNRDADVDVLGARVLATAPGQGRLIGSLANNLTDEASLESVTSPEGLADAEFKPVAVAGLAGINLAVDAEIAITGEFTAGDVIDLAFTFSTGETVTLGVPVVKNCFQYTQVPELGTNEGDAADEAADETGEQADADADAEEEHAEGDHLADGTDHQFNCADEAPSPEGGH